MEEKRTGGLSYLLGFLLGVLFMLLINRFTRHNGKPAYILEDNTK